MRVPFMPLRGIPLDGEMLDTVAELKQRTFERQSVSSGPPKVARKHVEDFSVDHIFKRVPIRRSDRRIAVCLGLDHVLLLQEEIRRRADSTPPTQKASGATN